MLDFFVMRLRLVGAEEEESADARFFTGGILLRTVLL